MTRDIHARSGGTGGGFSVIVHGGAGSVPPERLPGQLEGCRAAALAAGAVLRAGGSALDAACAAVVALEDDPRFNAGTGACLTEDGDIELDAAIVDGRELRAGGVCALPPFKNPILVARAVLEEGRHVLYAGAGGARFARARGFEPVPAEAMTTARARAGLEAVLRGEAESRWGAGGTVGAVARDRAGNVVAATSTGGRVAKRAGRVGDTPVPGAGTYADAAAGGASATGHGEGILRVVLTHSVVAALGAGQPVEAAARIGIELLGRRAGAEGGVIVLDREGRFGLARNTETMAWAALDERSFDPVTGS